MSGDGPSLDARLLAGGLLGAGFGAVVGLVVLGGILFVPALLMVAGAFVGASIAGGDHVATRSSRGFGYGSRAGRPPPAARRLPRPPWAGTTRTRPQSRSAAPAAGRRRRARVTGPVRIATPRPDLPRIDVNTADLEGLSRLPGIGRAAAARIVAYREAHGPFAILRDIEHVAGFDQARVARLAPRAMLSTPPPASPDGDAPGGDSRDPAPG